MTKGSNPWILRGRASIVYEIDEKYSFQLLQPIALFSIARELEL